MTVYGRVRHFSANQWCPSKLGTWNGQLKRHQITGEVAGILRPGRDLIKDLPLYLAFKKTSSYEIVLDLTFEASRLVSIVDLSVEMR